MNPNITVNSKGMAVTSTSCSGMRRILMRARQANALICARVARMGTDA